MCCFQLLILKWKNADYIYDSRSCHHRQEVASQTVRYSPQSNLNKAIQMISTKITAAVLEKNADHMLITYIDSSMPSVLDAVGWATGRASGL